MNCKDSTSEKGFKCGKFDFHKNSVVFVASDALAHYILMMHEVAHKEQYEEELQEAIDAQTKDSNFIRTALGMKGVNFEKDVIDKFLRCRNAGNFKKHLQRLRKNGLIGHDDYSIAIL